MNTLIELTRKIERAKPLSFGDIFSKSLDTFKKVWLQGLVSYLLSMVLALPLFFIFYVPTVVLGVINAETFEGDIEFHGMSAFAIIVIVLLFAVLFVGLATVTLALKAAFYRIVKNKELGSQASDDYFFFFRKAYLRKTIGLSLKILGILILAYVLCVLPVFYVIVPIYYMTLIYALNPDLSTAEIIKAGFILGNKKWFLSFGLVFVSAILSSLIGFLMCFIGIYITQQFVDLPCYSIYKEVIGLNDKSPIDEIGKY
ncbi:hypothetical protein [Cognatitamlana onchidii]|uniref:hypothetical protein n=1 Tax=Cognatitamlana onchidii TaxID=2562860 RepID=UPI0010A64CAD|nr:hypothetical protein [Algibacter onchidii]